MSFSLVFFGTPNGFKFVKKDFPEDGGFPELDNILIKIDSFGLNKQGMVDQQDRRWVVFKESVTDNVFYRGICLARPAKEASASRAGGYIGVGFLVRNAGFVIGDSLFERLNQLFKKFVEKTLDEGGFHLGLDYTDFVDSISRNSKNIKTLEDIFSGLVDSNSKSNGPLGGVDKAPLRPLALSVNDERQSLKYLLNYLDGRDSKLGSYALVIKESSSEDHLEEVKAAFDSEIQKTIYNSAAHLRQRFWKVQEREQEYRRDLKENDQELERLQLQMNNKSNDKKVLEQKIQEAQVLQSEIEKRLEVLEQEGKKISPEYSGPSLRAPSSSRMHDAQQQETGFTDRDTLIYQNQPNARVVAKKPGPAPTHSASAKNSGSLKSHRSTRNKKKYDLVLLVGGVVCLVFVSFIVWYFWPKSDAQPSGAGAPSGTSAFRATTQSGPVLSPSGSVNKTHSESGK